MFLEAKIASWKSQDRNRPSPDTQNTTKFTRWSHGIYQYWNARWHHHSCEEDRGLGFPLSMATGLLVQTLASAWPGLPNLQPRQTTIHERRREHRVIFSALFWRFSRVTRPNFEFDEDFGKLDLDFGWVSPILAIFGQKWRKSAELASKLAWVR